MKSRTVDPSRPGAQWVKRILLYIAGLLILAFAVSLSVKSDLGVSPVSSVPLVLSRVLGIELGNMTILVFCLYVLAQIPILRRSFRWVQLLQAACAVLFGKLVTLTSGWIAAWQPADYWTRICMILLSTVLIAVGIKLYLTANVVPQAADGLVQAIAKQSTQPLANVKNFFDLGSVALAATVSLLATGGVLGLREGTVIAALGVGRVLALLNRMDNGRIHRWIEHQQTDKEQPT